MASTDTLFAEALRLENSNLPVLALERYAAVLQMDPAHADAWHNRGLLLARLGRLKEAEDSHRDYARNQPASSRAHSDLADVLLALGRYEEALSSAVEASELDANAFLPRFTAALAAAMLRRFEESRKWFNLATRTDPEGFNRFLGRRASAGALDRDLDPRAIYLTREFDRLEHCDWRNRDAYVEDFRDLIDEVTVDPLSEPPLLFRSLSLPLPLPTRRRLAENVGKRLGAGTHKPHKVPSTDGGRIRIGYVSPDFRTHPTGILSAPLIRLHDRARFEVHAFSLAGPDGSTVRDTVERAADGFHDLSGLGLDRALSAVRGQRIDILIDLAGATTGALPELFALRTAPIQVSYLGFPGPSGTGLVDYLVCDGVCVPASDEPGYGEALARLPYTFWICEPAAATSAGRERRQDHGLPGDAVVLYAHHPGRKIDPAVFSAWTNILKAAPRSVLWLLDEHPDMHANLLREAQVRGIDAGRLIFAPRVPYAEYRLRIALADIALDTHVYNGGATTLDALVAGVPVLTCPFPGFAGRMAASALKAAGLGELVFPDLEGYAAAATELALNAAALSALKKRVASCHASPLFNAQRRTRELEAAYERIHDRACRGLSPASFDL